MPFMVADTLPPFDSSGFGTTLKLSAESAPSFPEHDVRSIIDAADNRKRCFFCIAIKIISVYTYLYDISSCRERDSNPHSHYWPRDFKSLVSTNSTIAAFFLVLERKTGLGPATSTLARSRSTNCA